MEAAVPSRPPELVDAPAWARILGVAAHMPAALASGFYLECRLGDTPGSTDLIVRTPAHGIEILAGLHPALRSLWDRRTHHPAWERLARFCTSWCGDPVLQEAVQDLWLEFDLDPSTPSNSAEEAPPPSLFFTLSRRPRTARSWGTLVTRIFGALGVEDSVRKRIDPMCALIEAGPPGTGVEYLGLLTGRPGDPARVYLSGWADPEGRELRRWLQCARWPGSLPDLDRALAPFRWSETGVRRGMVHLDLEDRVLPRLGIEYTLARPSQLHGRIREGTLLRRLTQAGLCLATEGAGLLRWPGHSVLYLPHELWPSLVVRRVNCVKLVHEPGRPPSAKAYLWTGWTPLSKVRSSPGSTRSLQGSPGPARSPSSGGH